MFFNANDSSKRWNGASTSDPATAAKNSAKGELIGHRTEYKKYLINNNKKDNAESQVEYVLDNIFTKGKGSGFDIGAGNKEMLRLTFSSGNASNIAEVFMNLWERPKMRLCWFNRQMLSKYMNDQ